jgi:hypothetical protein
VARRQKDQEIAKEKKENALKELKEQQEEELKKQQEEQQLRMMTECQSLQKLCWLDPTRTTLNTRALSLCGVEGWGEASYLQSPLSTILGNASSS